MISIGESITVTRSMSHNPKHRHVIFNHPILAQREIAIMLLLKKTPMYSKDIEKAIGSSRYSTQQSLTELKKTGLVGKYRRWYLKDG